MTCSNADGDRSRALMRGGWIRLWRRVRRPVVRQQDQSDCGPAALLSVLRYWGGDASLAHVRGLAGTDVRGTTLLALAHAARRLGLDARGAKGEYRDLRRERMPCIAHVRSDEGRPHYLVLFAVRERSVLVGDPASGTAKLSRECFEHRWRSRTVLLITPSDRITRAPPPHWLRWIASYFEQERSWLIQSLFLGASATALGLATAVFIQLLIDRFIPERDTAMICATGTIIFTLLFVRAGAGYLRQRFLVEMNERVSVHVNEDFLAHLFRLPLRFFDSRRTGDVTSRIADGVRIQRAFLEIVGTGVVDGLVVAGSLLFLVLIAPPLAPLGFAAIPLYGILLLKAARKLEERHRSVMQSYADAESGYIESLEGIEAILASNASEPFADWNASLYRTFQRRRRRLGLTDAGVRLISELAGGAAVLISLVWGASVVVADELQLGQLVAGYSLLAGMLPSVDRLVRTNVVFQEASVAASRLQDLLLATPEPRGGTVRFRLSRALELRGAAFEWPSGQPLLREIDLAIRPGQLSGLWGPNGAGKSTIARILNRSYPLSRGQLLLDGASAERISVAEYRRCVALLPGKVKVFGGTLADNVLLGRAVQADERAALPDSFDGPGFHERFPEGWSTRIGEGGRTISDGEAHLVGLLRALVTRPRVLLVDEGIRATDVETSELMLGILQDYSREHGVLLISHDLRILVRTERLHLLDRGTISVAGSPRQLYEDHQRFRTLCELQLAAPPWMRRDRASGSEDPADVKAH